MNILSWVKTSVGPVWGPLDSEGKLTSLEWGAAPEDAEVVRNHPLQAALETYFSGKSGEHTATWPGMQRQFAEHITLQGTPFQRRVWQALLEIPYGTTVTYGELAARLGSSPRAVGGAVGANPVAILVPCHRVMGVGGRMTGFSAPGGIAIKQMLLRQEGVLC